MNPFLFQNNGAAGYFGFSSYASSGAGGAIMTKFSTYSISYSTFTGNWVSAGGMQISVGGAIAMFYEPTDTLEKSRIQYCSFLNNSALSQTCYYAGSKSGQGGAISVVGASYQGLLITHSNFTGWWELLLFYPYSSCYVHEPQTFINIPSVLLSPMCIASLD